jgi:hypothetical protein
MPSEFKNPVQDGRGARNPCRNALCTPPDARRRTTTFLQKDLILKYTVRKMSGRESQAASEIRSLLACQELKLGHAAIAHLMGVTVETINSIVYRGRIPGVGMINGLARILKLKDAQIKKLMDLRQTDLLNRKVADLTLSGNNEVESIVAILGVLSEQQMSEVRKLATTFALANLSSDDIGSHRLP